MATAHLLYGFLGAGKTTFARKLEKDLGAIRFTYDEWMHRLYGANPSVECFAECLERVSTLIWDYAEVLLRLNQDVILDGGFWTRAARDEARGKLVGIGADFRLYFVECSPEIMKVRVRERTAKVPKDSLWIDENAFELFKARFELLDADEVHEVVRS